MGDASSTGSTVIDVYQRHGVAWARLRAERFLETRWLDRFCDLLPVDGTVLDIGCGSGVPIGRDLVRRGFTLTGIDGSQTMLAQFRLNLPGVEARLGDMRRLVLERRFEGLLAWDSFFHLPPEDQRAMFPRFRLHAAPGAALMFTSGAAEGEAIGELEGAPLYHASLDPDEYRSLLAAAGFALIAHSAEDPACGYRTIWLARQNG